MICAFFGHRYTPSETEKMIEDKIGALMKEYPDIKFYVGNHGNFDRMSISALKRMSAQYTVVLAYLPDKSNGQYSDSPTIYPEGLENVIPRFAIEYRNKWIADRADIVICYVLGTAGGAYKAVARARARGCRIINLADK